MATPQTPVYAKAIPKIGVGPRRFNNIYIPSFAELIKEVEVTSDDPRINVIDNSDAEKYSFELVFEPAVDLDVTLSLIAKIAGAAQTLPILKGRTIDEVELDWTFNVDSISSQSLSNNGGATDPPLVITDREYDYEGLSIEENTTFTLSADDGKNLDGSLDAASAVVTFGNYYYYGAGPSLIGQSNSIQAFIDGLTKDIETDRVKNILPTGGVNEHHFFAYPASFGLPSDIKKGIFSGGYLRLLNVGGVFQTSLGQGDVESDLNLSNGLVSEPYYIFQSLIDNQVDPNIPVEIT